MNINNINCYGYFCNNNIQYVKDDQSFQYITTECSESSFMLINSSNIVIINPGFYLINVIMILDCYGQVALYINDRIIEHTITSSDEDHMIMIHTKLNLNENDTIAIKNYNTEDTIISRKIKKNKLTDNMWNIKLSILQIY